MGQAGPGRPAWVLRVGGARGRRGWSEVRAGELVLRLGREEEGGAECVDEKCATVTARDLKRK